MKNKIQLIKLKALIYQKILISKKNLDPDHDLQKKKRKWKRKKNNCNNNNSHKIIKNLTIIIILIKTNCKNFKKSFSY